MYTHKQTITEHAKITGVLRDYRIEHYQDSIIYDLTDAALTSLFT